MFHCGMALLEWMFSELKVKTAELQVFSHNEKAIGLYKRLGFATTESLPLRRAQEEGMIKFSIVDRSEANAGFDYLKMELPVKRYSGVVAWAFSNRLKAPTAPADNVRDSGTLPPVVTKPSRSQTYISVWHAAGAEKSRRNGGGSGRFRCGNYRILLLSCPAAP